MADDVVIVLAIAVSEPSCCRSWCAFARWRCSSFTEIRCLLYVW